MFDVPSDNHHLIRSSLPTSHGFQPIPDDDDTDDTPNVTKPSSRFGELFARAATIDQTPYLCVPSALKFSLLLQSRP